MSIESPIMASPLLRLAAHRGVWPLLLYGTLSSFCYVLSFEFIEARVANVLAPFLWLFGPTAMLVYRLQFVRIYLAETVVIFGLVLPAIFIARRSPGASAILAVITAVVWAFLGFLAYTPAM